AGGLVGGLAFLGDAGAGVRAGLGQGRRGAKGQHRDARGFEPGEPSQPARCYPKRKRVGLFEKAAERLERRHRLQVDRNLFAVAVRRLAVNDLDVKTRQARRRPGCANLTPSPVSLELRQRSSPLFLPSPTRYRSAAARASSIMAAEIFSADYH